MFADNPFAALSATVSPIVMQTYVVVMIFLVVGGTLYDMNHKKSAIYFFGNWRNARSKSDRQLDGRTMAALAAETVVEGLTSGEFCGGRRRIAHLATMYGFLAYAITTIVMVFGYPTAATPTPVVLPQLWYIGALMVCLGGYWFWFFMRVDVTAEGYSPFRIVRADLFILSLLASTTLAVVWASLQAIGSAWTNVFLGLYLVATTTLFGTVAWSKFSHMFYKPAAAFQKRVEDANGSRSNLPLPADKPEIFGSARRQPNHY